MTKRTAHGRSRRKISAEAIAAGKAGDRRALYFALDLRPWLPHPLDVDENAAPPPPDGTVWVEDYPMIQDLRREMILPAGQPPAHEEEE